MNGTASVDGMPARDLMGRCWMLARKDRRIKGRSFSFQDTGLCSVLGGREKAWDDSAWTGSKKNWQEFTEHWCCIGVVITFSELCFKYNEVASVSQNVIGEKRGMDGVASRAPSPSRTWESRRETLRSDFIDGERPASASCSFSLSC